MKENKDLAEFGERWNFIRYFKFLDNISIDIRYKLYWYHVLAAIYGNTRQKQNEVLGEFASSHETYWEADGVGLHMEDANSIMTEDAFGIRKLV